MSSIKEYFSSVGKGISSLAKGMAVTGKELVTPKVTEQYPENRKTLKIADRFRAELTLIGDDATPAYNKCIACGICQMNCPNSSIELKTRFVELPDGKKKKVLDKYYYDLGSCTFCMLCVTTCPQDALEFSNDFEQAVFTRDKLVKVLNAHSELTDEQVIAEASKPKPKPAMDPEQLAKIKAEALAKAAAKKAAQEAAAQKGESPKPEAPKPEAPKAETSEPEAPKAEA